MEKKLPESIKDVLASFEIKQPLRLMFQDEARFGRISDCCYCWCKKPQRPMVEAMLSHQYGRSGVFQWALYVAAEGHGNLRVPANPNATVGGFPVSLTVNLARSKYCWASMTSSCSSALASTMR